MSSFLPNPAPIYSTTSKTSPVPPNLIPISEAMTHILRYALNLGPHLASLSKQATLVQTMSGVQPPISSPLATPTSTFNVHLDVPDHVFLKKKLGDCKRRLESARLISKGENPSGKVFAPREQSFRDGTGAALTEPLRNHLGMDREKRLTSATRNLIGLKCFGLLSPKQSTGRAAISVSVSTVPSTISAVMAVSPSRHKQGASSTVIVG